MTQTPYYETMYILRPDIPEEEVESHLTKYRDILVEAGAEVLDNQMRGKRRLAYAINKNKEGIYVQLSHNGDGQQVAVLAVVIFALIECLRGKEPDLPGISQAVRMQLY